MRVVMAGLAAAAIRSLRAATAATTIRVATKAVSHATTAARTKETTRCQLQREPRRRLPATAATVARTGSYNGANYNGSHE